MQSFSRREFVLDFLYTLSGFIALRSLSLNAAELTTERILIPSVQNKEIRKAYLMVYEPQSGRMDKIEIPLTTAHSVALHPDRSKVVVVEKWQPTACEVDLVRKKVTRVFKTKGQRNFYGHGVFSKDGKLFYATEQIDDPAKERGWIVVRDATTYEVVDEMPSYGESPHDITISQDGHTLIVSNIGVQVGPNISFVDIQSKQLVHQFTHSNRKLMPEHFRLIDESRTLIGYSEVFMAGKVPTQQIEQLRAQNKHAEILELYRALYEFTPSPTALAKFDKGLLDMHTPSYAFSKMRHTLSLSVDTKKQKAALTHVDDKIVSFWDLQKNVFIKMIEFEKSPLGITYSDKQNCFIVTTKERKIYWLDRDRLEIVKSLNLPGDFDPTAHIASLTI